jgi:hypothetical protein
VARGGQDKTVFACRKGNWFAPLEKHRGAETRDGWQVAQLILDVLSRYGGYVAIDSEGIGASAYDIAKTTARQRVSPVLFGSGSDRMDKTGVLRFANMRAQAYWTLRELLDPHNSEQIALPPDNELMADLTTARYSITPRGVIIESKDDIRKRIGRSPDCGDAVALACCIGPPATWIDVSHETHFPAESLGDWT